MSVGEPLLWFLHIPKTAGTTFGAILERNIARREMIDVYPGFGLRLTELRTLSPARIARARCVRGHFDFGAHRAIERPFRYITFLRRPEQQVASRWNHARSTRRHPLHRFAVERGLAGFARDSPDNFQLRSLLELEPVDGRHPPLGERHVDEALGNLDRHFAVAGLAERFDESLVLMSRRLPLLRRIHYVRRNVRRRTGDRGGGPSDEARTAIERATGLDRLLYDRVRERFDSTLAAEPGFADALARFRESNARYARRMRLPDAVAHRWGQALRLARLVAARAGFRP